MKLSDLTEKLRRKIPGRFLQVLFNCESGDHLEIVAVVAAGVTIEDVIKQTSLDVEPRFGSIYILKGSVSEVIKAIESDVIEQADFGQLRRMNSDTMERKS